MDQVLRLRDILEAAEPDMNLELYWDNNGKRDLIEFDTTSYEEVAFQPVLMLIPLIGSAENPDPSFGVVLSKEDVELTEELVNSLPTPPKLLDFIGLFIPEAILTIENAFGVNDFLFNYEVLNKFPDPPIIKIIAVEKLTRIIIPKRNDGPQPEE